MKRLFLLLALFGVLAVGCEELFPTEQSPNATPVFSTDGEDDYIISADGEEITIMVTTNIDYSVVIPEDAEEWLSVADTRALRVDTLSFIVAPNDTAVERTTIVKFVDDSNNILQTISFTQNAAAQSESVCPNNEIWYTNGSTTEATTPYKTNDFGANIVSNTYDVAKECWVIKFDSNVTTIGYYTFYNCRSLTSVTIPDSVTTIDSCAFLGCSSLTSVTIPDSVTSIENHAFYGCCSLISVTIPDSVTMIGYEAFYRCESLTSVTIPDSVTTIGWGAFNCCTSLTSVTIPDSVTSIGYAAFCRCSSLQEFRGKFASEDNRCLIIDGTLNSFAPAGLTEYTVPDNVTTIGDRAFQGCDSLKSVTIPDSVTTIGDEAFSDCDSLESATIPDSVTTIGHIAFYDCSSLREFNGKFASEEGRCLIIDGTLNAFAPAGLTEYTIPNSVTTIGQLAFCECRSLTSVTIGDSVTTIGESAFYWCDSLTSVTIPDSVTTIENNAFYLCNSLTSVTIPESVTKIGDYAFDWCHSLTSVYCKAITPPAGSSSMFSSNASGRKIYVPMESVEAYKSAYGWSEYADAIVGYDFDRNEEVVQPEQPGEIPNNQIWYTSTDGEIVEPYSGEYNNNADALTTFGVNIVSNTYADGKGVIEFDGDVTTIGEWAFAECSSLTSVTIGDSVTEIGYAAFHSCNSFTSVTIPDSVTTIRDGAFAYCSSLTNVTIPDSVTEIGELAFFECSSLTSVTIPDSVTSIGYGAFGDCSSLTSVTIGDSVTTIGDRAFAGCSNLTSVTIPDSVTTIEMGAFSGCHNLQEFKGELASEDGRGIIIDCVFESFAPAGLTEYTIPNSVTTIGDGAFYWCESLTSVTIPDTVTTIGERAFEDCSSLTSIAIPDSVTTIGRSAFSDCHSLTSVTIPDSVTEIGDEAFCWCESLTSITIPDSVTEIGYEAFAYCSSLTSITIPDSVTSIGNSAFYWCESLTSVYCKPTTPPAALFYEEGWYAFYNNAPDRKIYVPTESVKAYRSASGWRSYSDYIEGYNF